LGEFQAEEEMLVKDQRQEKAVSKDGVSESTVSQESLWLWLWLWLWRGDSSGIHSPSPPQKSGRNRIYTHAPHATNLLQIIMVIFKQQINVSTIIIVIL
jgi:hypothetical protein